MKNKIGLMYLAAGCLLALTGGCGKTENTAPPTRETATKAVEPKPGPAAEQPVAYKPSELAPGTNAAQRTLDQGVKTTESAIPPVQEAAPKVAAATNAAATNATKQDAQASPGQAKTLADLSNDQMVQGLQEALAKGLQQAIARLGHDGGFLTNPSVKIPMPEKLQKVETALRAMKQDKLADDFVNTMNHAAEQAVPEAGGVFAEALKQMTIADGKSILSGPNDAATQYFQKATQTNLYSKFYPIIKKATEQTGVTAAYKNMLDKVSSGHGLGSLGGALGGSVLGADSLDIDAYVTNKSLDGLFKMVSEEETRIRQNPVARTTDMLQKVFGAMK